MNRVAHAGSGSYVPGEDGRGSPQRGREYTPTPARKPASVALRLGDDAPQEVGSDLSGDNHNCGANAEERQREVQYARFGFRCVADHVIVTKFLTQEFRGDGCGPLGMEPRPTVPKAGT